MASTNPVSFSIDYDEDGVIVKIKKATGEEVPRQSAEKLYQIMPDVAACKKSMTEIYTTTPSSGKNDPCVVQGGDLWCW